MNKTQKINLRALDTLQSSATAGANNITATPFNMPATGNINYESFIVEFN